jgi:hypothetical protein
MEKTKKMQGIHPAQEKKEEGIWLPPQQAASFFRNGRGMKVSALMYNLRSGKLDDIAFRDAFGWHVFIPQRILEQKDLNHDKRTESFSAA